MSPESDQFVTSYERPGGRRLAGPAVEKAERLGSPAEDDLPEALVWVEQ
jgi:hypothetical protein